MHISIKNESIEKSEKIAIDNALWGYTKYTPRVYANIVYDESGFEIKFTAVEKNPTRTKTNHFEFVHEDSCVEFFVNFDPKNSDKYINFETNANGAMNVAFRSDRYNEQRLELSEIESFNITPNVEEEFWTISYKIGFDFIKKYYHKFNIEECEYIMGNLYKCGDKTPEEHYMSHFEVKCDTPDFHRPEYFGKMWVCREGKEDMA